MIRKYIKNITTHGMSRTNIYTRWIDMKKRCNNPKNKEYHNYGARGIKVCSEWDNDFLKFYNWSIDNGFEESLSIDRINVNLGYSPSNCKWIPMNLQGINKRLQKNNKTGIKGVNLSIRNKYIVRISIYGKRHYIGEYNTLEEAKLAREEAELLYWGGGANAN